MRLGGFGCVFLEGDLKFEYDVGCISNVYV